MMLVGYVSDERYLALLKLLYAESKSTEEPR